MRVPVIMIVAVLVALVGAGGGLGLAVDLVQGHAHSLGEGAAVFVFRGVALTATWKMRDFDVDDAVLGVDVDGMALEEAALEVLFADAEGGGLLEEDRAQGTGGSGFS